MSDLIAKTQLSDSRDCPLYSKPVEQEITARQALLGENLRIRRVLPTRERRMIGAWCFLDHFGPLELKNGHELDVAPHPHIGLQTFTWILQGEILHRDSLGSEQIIKPGQVNLMTAGKGIAHSEESIDAEGILQGVQLWIALTDSDRHRDPAFVHYSQLPKLDYQGLTIQVMVGEFNQVKAPTAVYSPLIGLDIQAYSPTTIQLPLEPKFEYGILPLSGDIQMKNKLVDSNTLLYLGCGRSELELTTTEKARFLLIGGEPFTEEVLIWWNFVARTKEEIRDVIQAWNENRYFGEVKGYQGKRLYAPLMP